MAVPEPFVRALSWRARAALGALFVVLIAVMIRPTPTHLGRDVPANLGDPLFLVWTMRFVGHQLVHNPTHLFDGNMMWPHDLTVAFADPMLSAAPVFAAWHTLTNGWAPALDLTILSFVLLNLAATFTLARWLTARTDAALVAAVANGFNSYVLGHWGHTQLQTLGLFPLALLLLGKLLEERRTKTAVLLGLVTAAMFTGALYYAAIYAVVVVVIVIGYVIVTRFSPGAGLVRKLLITAAVAGVLIAPTAVAYLRVQDLPGLERPLIPQWGLDATDLLHPAAGSYVHGGLRPPASLETPWEHQFFPGLLVLGLAAVGFVALARGRGASGGVPRGRRQYLVLLVVAGATAGALALGPDVHGYPGPFRFFHAHVPAFGGIRVASRLAAPLLLAIALLAAHGYVALTRRLRSVGWRAGLAAVAVGVTLLELAAPIPWARLPVDRATLAPYRALDRRPAGAVVELPMVDPRKDGAAWAYIEAPRMVYSTLDWHPRVNGYTSIFLDDYLYSAVDFATFPSPQALARARSLELRYVILHVGAERGYPAYTEADASRIVKSLPSGWRASRHGSAWLLEMP